MPNTNIHHSRGRGRSTAEKRTSSVKYLKNKRVALELERRNFRHLVLYPASDIDTNKKQFYNMGGHSAIIYVHEIAPRLKRKAILRRDLDRLASDDKFPSGVCSIADLNGLETRLSAIGVKKEKASGDLIFFKLAREYSKDEILGMLKYEQKRIDTLNEIIYPEILLPDVHRRILVLKRMIPAKVKNMDKIYREVVGMEMMQSLFTLIKNYTCLTHGDLDLSDTTRNMRIECDMLLAGVSMMNELRVWDIDSCTSAAMLLTEIADILKKQTYNEA